MNSNKFIQTTQRSHVRDTAAMDSRSSLAETLDHLNELIMALDRRMPRVQRAGEAAVVSAAAELRMEAMKRIAEIRGQMGRLQ